jgi:hypothetical protein
VNLMTIRGTIVCGCGEPFASGKEFNKHKKSCRAYKEQTEEDKLYKEALKTGTDNDAVFRKGLKSKMYDYSGKKNIQSRNIEFRVRR